MEEDYTHRRLWAGVIIQALIDATSEPTTPVTRVEKDRAISWLTIETGVTAQDFEAVCLAANVEPKTVRSFYLSYNGPPLTMRRLSRLRDAVTGASDANLSSLS